MFITICILIWLISTILWIIWVYNEEKRWLCDIGDLIDKTEFFMWFPIANTIILIGFMLILFFYKILRLLKLDVLWEKFRNIKL
jgi:hypothetical protein